MSKVRIYELAKEAGMSSKMLIDKLNEHGYEIKGASSTVEDDIADKIRTTVFQSSKAEVADKKSVAEETPVAARRTTVIRRRPTVAPEAKEVEDVPVIEGAALEDKEVQVPETLQKPVVEEFQEAEADTDVREPVAPVVVDFKEQSKDQQKDLKAAPVRHEKKAIVAEEPEPASRKGLARVVGSIEIQVEEKPPVVEKPRKRSERPAERPATGGGYSRPQPSAPKPPVNATPLSDASKGKKKGKRGAEVEDAEPKKGGAWKADKFGQKGRGKVQVTRFGDEYSNVAGKRGKRSRGRVERKVIQPAVEMKAIKKRIKVLETISVADLAHRMGVKSSEIIAKLMGFGVMATLNQALDVDTATLIGADFGYEVEQGITEEIGVLQLNEQEGGGELMPRSPVVTVMGHVDHGKTSILDAIRKTDVADGEAGGITQHIGAYHVTSSSGDVTFVDTPGHAAFTEMRSRGAQITDLVVLVVAADDGVMDQTREAIRHAQAAGVPILVAVNKIDKENADPDRVKRELSDLGLAPEEWGGQTMYCETSAKKNIGIDNLLDSIQLMAEVMELKADATRKARGRVVEAKLDKGRGPVATILVQEGTLKAGDYFVVGQFSGKVRALINDKNKPLDEAGPSIPVEVQGLTGVPQAGDEFIVVTDEKMARSVSQARILKARELELASGSKVSLDRLFEKMNEEETQELRVVLRADVQGTLEAFCSAAEKLSTDAVKVRILHEGTGTITESDILLASASDAIIIGFNVRPTTKVKELSIKEHVDVRSYDVIYHALDDIRKAMVGMLEPTFVEEVIGNAEVRQLFHVPKIGTIAGCSVIDGKITRKASVRVIREGVVLHTGKIGSLRRVKDDVREVLTGYECGIGIDNYNDLLVGDILEAFILNEVEATLEG
ncbi:MAG: translation initiation factor IF-2 [Proteobacteria bacterium]|jgi:translation initiation factor IF-2|nr:translation initiation factor IF-2 [Desulfocapsa sp.]MBU3943429.1 translation initiation factor IF-2 [Pseudomonadota bacterium]MCG2743925.1 translation initiation factor IF-2 [Desulfobacteraceae bacterium]MBU3984060.1 translation initiation factor IF-2 [Pseudomonadota bacterium]MBU4030435.1 translation initiation factor IF-2 [Pseudomonadota bacterium]